MPEQQETGNCAGVAQGTGDTDEPSNPIHAGANRREQGDNQKGHRMRAKMLSYRFYSETIMLALIAYADTVSTLWLVNTGLAVEANPVMAYYLSQGALWFIAIKLLMVLPAFAVDLNKAHNPRRVRLSLRGALILYVGIYGLGTLAQTVRLIA